MKGRREAAYKVLELRNTSLFANWKPRRPGLENTELNFTVDTLFNRDHPPGAGRRQPGP